jgi:hypothetical protein
VGRTHNPDAAAAPPGRARAALRLCVLAAAALGATSCKPNKRYDLIEAELRTRNRELAETQAALEQTRNLNRAFEQQLGQNAQPGAPAPAAGVPVCIPVRDIALGRGTGGFDDDGCPGDEALMAVIVPQDYDGSAVKVPARAVVSAFEVLPNGLKNPIGNWDVPAEKLRPTWRSGLFGSGYYVVLPWQTFPTTDRVRVVARLTTLDGRAFEVDRDVMVRPMPGRVPPGTPFPTTPVVPPGREPLLPGPAPSGVPPQVEELPPPRTTSSDRGARLLPAVRE